MEYAYLYSKKTGALIRVPKSGAKKLKEQLTERSPNLKSEIGLLDENSLLCVSEKGGKIELSVVDIQPTLPLVC